MKQRVIVQALVRQGDKVLLLRRSQGRPSDIGKFELPGGTLDPMEQPDDALRRHLVTNVGIKSMNFDLCDVISASSRDGGEMQQIFVVYELSDVIESTPLDLGVSYDESIWANVSSLSQVELRDSAKLILNANGLNLDVPEAAISNSSEVVKNATDGNSVIIYSDGGSRGNPGPSAAAYVIMDRDRNVLNQGGEYLGITTNNQAEYHGVRLGLEKALQMKCGIVEYRMDSMLVVNQLKGIYKIKNRELWPINERINELIGNFELIKFIHIPRELNHVADGLVNKILDEHRNDS
jgi:ribonuclease HI/ADP-ribose pyrophosphatase YjhB (NUDIX family)